MKGRVIALGQIAGREAAALMEDGRLQDLLVAPEDTGPMPGAIYRAKVGRPMKGQGGAILDTPDGPLFLRQAKGLRPGQGLIVQVVSKAEGHKAAPATPRVLIKSRYVIGTPGAPGVNISRDIRDDEVRLALREATADIDLPNGTGLILRSAAAESVDAMLDDLESVLPVLAGISAETNEGEPSLLLEAPSPADLAWRDWPQPDLMDDGARAFDDHGVWDALEDLRAPAVRLSSGGAMSVEATRALVAVDVDTGGDTSPAAGLKANMAALKELPRQLRLRGLGGQIVVDLAPFNKKERKPLESVLRTALKADPIETTIVGWSALGLMELQRKRERPALGDF